jgi:ABC-type bacteriocin/lantibiotic exporter with double-glycine peptidase domain
MRADSADLVVFDEPSSALDPHAEAELFDRIHALSHAGNGATTIFISHRFNTVRKADRIAFVQDGVSARTVISLHRARVRGRRGYG